MDKFDQKILELLQEDATLSLQEISSRIGLSATPCWRRVQRMESEGVIRRRVALLDPGKLNLGVTVFVTVRTNRHDHAWLKLFYELVSSLTEVIEFYRMAGQADYLLRVVVPDIPAYDRVYKRLIGTPDLGDVTSSFAMEKIKYTTRLPLTYVNEQAGGDI